MFGSDNRGVRRRTKVVDVIETIEDLKWSWAGHVACISDNRWTKRIIGVLEMKYVESEVDNPLGGQMI